MVGSADAYLPIILASRAARGSRRLRAIMRCRPLTSLVDAGFAGFAVVTWSTVGALTTSPDAVVMFRRRIPCPTPVATLTFRRSVLLWAR